MKKLLLTCFLALLCLVGRYFTASSKVADSPPEKSLHRSTFYHVSPHSGDTHRGGAILSDTFTGFDFGLVDSDQDMGAGEEALSLQPAPVTVLAPPISQISNSPNQFSLELSGDEASVIQHRSSDIQHRSPDTQHQSSLTSQHPHPPAQVGDESSVLIYGEIINPDSLGPLTLRAIPYYLDEKSSFLKETFPITMEKGEFFDGVLNPMVKKFTIRFHVPPRASYFSLFLGDKPILENYLSWPGDSLKISLDLKHQQVLFAGEKSAFYEAQYLIKRQQAQREFATPRQLVIPATSSLLQDQEKAQKFEKFKNIYGSQLLVLQPGKPSLDLWMEEIRNSEKILGPQLSVLDSFSEILNADQLDLLQAEIYGGFYFSALSTFRKFHWAGLDKHLSPEEKEHYLGQIRQLVTGIRDQGFGIQTKLVSAGYLNLTLEKIILLALMDHRSFSAIIEENFQGELADRIKASYLSNYLSAHTDQEKLLGDYLASTSHSPWKDRMEQLKQSHVTGQPILPITLTDLQGNRISGEDLDGVPTLIYFYFSSCSHSADYFKNQLFPLYQKIKERGIRLIAVSVDEDPELWRSRISRYSDPSIPNFNLSGDSKTLWKESYEINSYPRVMFLDSEAQILSFNIRVLSKGDKSLLEEFEHHFHDQFSDKPKSNPAL